SKLKNDRPGVKLLLMLYRTFLIALLSLILAVPLRAQISRDAKFEILRTVMAEQAASRIVMPFGTDGVELSDTGEVNNQRLETDIKKNGQSIEGGKGGAGTAID